MFALRSAIVMMFALAGYLAGGMFGAAPGGLAMGLAIGLLANMMDYALKGIAAGAIIGGLIGLSMGLLATALLLMPFKGVFAGQFPLAWLVLGSLLGYGGMIVGLNRTRNMKAADLVRMFMPSATGNENLKILDTSVIIDGRIADICETGFIDGEFVVPQFILHELQHIADSPDSLKRARGRRGLDILHRVQKMHQITVRIVEDDFPKIREVDAKLVALGKKFGAKVVTNDFNLNKVAELQGVQVLNINELANSLKPLVLPGEPLNVFVIKEGKEHNQGVAYLEDGTMVVVDNGKRFIGQKLDVTVTSVLQTTAGRMIFTKTREEYDREEVRASR